jgi:hypothetical protein
VIDAWPARTRVNRAMLMVCVGTPNEHTENDSALLKRMMI